MSEQPTAEQLSMTLQLRDAELEAAKSMLDDVIGRNITLTAQLSLVEAQARSQSFYIDELLESKADNEVKGLALTDQVIELEEIQIKQAATISKQMKEYNRLCDSTAVLTTKLKEAKMETASLLMAKEMRKSEEILIEGVLTEVLIDPEIEIKWPETSLDIGGR